jgi:cystathionine gamma-synthase
VLPESDLLITSLTKSFSGYSDVMGGSTALNPLSPHYVGLKDAYSKNFHNELFVGDADTLLSNSEDYLARSIILNKNAAAMVAYLQAAAQDPLSPVARVLYPSLLPDKALYDKHLRKPTPDFPEPGYGCLFTVDFESVETAAAFFDTLQFYPGPHLGAHKTLSLCYNTVAYGKKKDEEKALRAFGLLEEAVRVSAGLESEEDLIETLREALDVAKEAKAKAAAKGEEASGEELNGPKETNGEQAVDGETAKVAV